jgi:hypothetical protein
MTKQGRHSSILSRHEAAFRHERIIRNTDHAFCVSGYIKPYTSVAFCHSSHTSQTLPLITIQAPLLSSPPKYSTLQHPKVNSIESTNYMFTKAVTVALILSSVVSAAPTINARQDRCQNAYKTCIAAGTPEVACSCTVVTTCVGEDSAHNREYCASATANFSKAASTPVPAFTSIPSIPGGCNPAHPGSCHSSYFDTTKAPAATFTPIPGIPGGCNPAYPGSCPSSYFDTTKATPVATSTSIPVIPGGCNPARPGSCLTSAAAAPVASAAPGSYSD